MRIVISCSVESSNFVFRNKIYITPSGVQKERLESSDLFVQDIDGNDLELPPPNKKFKKSQCTPLFMCAYKGENMLPIWNTLP